MEYFLVIWVERLRSLRRRANRPDKSIPEAEAKKKMIQAKRRLKKAERSIKITLGSGFQAAAANAGAVMQMSKVWKFVYIVHQVDTRVKSEQSSHAMYVLTILYQMKSRLPVK